MTVHLVFDAAAVCSDSLLSQVPGAVAQKLIDAGHLRTLNAGDLIHCKGDTSLDLHRVIAGAVRISSASVDGRGAIFSYYGPGDWFGHIGLIDGQPRTHDIHACGPCTLLNVPNSRVHPLLEQYPVLYKAFANLLCQMIRRSFIRLEDHALLSIAARLAKHLVTLADAYGEPNPKGVLIKLHLPQEDLSMLLGSTRQTINRKLSEWARLGWIEVHYSEIVLCNREALTQIYF